MRKRLELTENQRLCLRLVAQGMTSKEIASRVGLSPSTVDTYLKMATATLGAANRREAARRYLADEAGGDELSQGLGYQPAAVADAPKADEEIVVPVVEGSPAPSRAKARGPFTPPPIGGPENDLTAGQRLSEVMRISLFMAAVMTCLILFAIGALRVLR